MEIKILRPIDIWPGKNNGYRVECTYDDGNKMEQLMHKQEVNKHNYLKIMKKKLSKKDFDELEKMIEEWGDFRYDQAMQSAAEDAAGECM